jgi:hypothetical protein
VASSGNRCLMRFLHAIVAKGFVAQHALVPHQRLPRLTTRLLRGTLALADGMRLLARTPGLNPISPRAWHREPRLAG